MSFSLKCKVAVVQEKCIGLRIELVSNPHHNHVPCRIQVQPFEVPRRDISPDDLRQSLTFNLIHTNLISMYGYLPDAFLAALERNLNAFQRFVVILVHNEAAYDQGTFLSVETCVQKS